MTDKDELRGYRRGYAAGRKCVKERANADALRKREAARHDRFMCAALTGLLAHGQPWGKTVDGKFVPSGGAEGYAGTVKLIADAMLARAHP